MKKSIVLEHRDDSRERPASEKYRFFIKFIEKNIVFERGGERQATPASGRDQKSIDF